MVSVVFLVNNASPMQMPKRTIMGLVAMGYGGGRTEVSFALFSSRVKNFFPSCTTLNLRHSIPFLVPSVTYGPTMSVPILSCTTTQKRD